MFIDSILLLLSMNAYCCDKDNTCWDKCKLLLIKCATNKALLCDNQAGSFNA